MSETEKPTKKPSEVLAELVFNKLIEKKIVLPDDARKALIKLADGKLKAEDWRVLIEKGIDKESSDE